MPRPKHKDYDIAVIGGGPAGMYAAGRAASLGASVVLIEKNGMVGKKLLITGGGRCNMTNVGIKKETLTKIFGKKGNFLFSPFDKHDVDASLKFFHDRNVPTKVENDGRIFPVSDDAGSVRSALVAYMKEGKVDVMTNIAGTGFHTKEGKVVGLNTDKETVVAKSYILTTGGSSHPETGSDGAPFEWLNKIGHTIHKPDSALVPIKTKERWSHDLRGVSHQNIKLSIFQNGKRTESSVGRMVFTDFGVSGPLVLNMSKKIREAMDYAPTEISLDLMHEVLPDMIDKTLLVVFAENSNMKIKNVLKEIIPPAFVRIILKLSKINPEKEANEILKEERLELGRKLKDMRMTPNGFLEPEKAIVASGGVAPEEVDFRTMRSKIYRNLYFAGDVLDIDRPSGGYSLQLCWTTGFVAGTTAAEAKR